MYKTYKSNKAAKLEAQSDSLTLKTKDKWEKPKKKARHSRSDCEIGKRSNSSTRRKRRKRRKKQADEVITAADVNYITPDTQERQMLEFHTGTPVPPKASPEPSEIDSPRPRLQSLKLLKSAGPNTAYLGTPADSLQVPTAATPSVGRSRESSLSYTTALDETNVNVYGGANLETPPPPSYYQSAGVKPPESTIFPGDAGEVATATCQEILAMAGARSAALAATLTLDVDRNRLESQTTINVEKKVPEKLAPGQQQQQQQQGGRRLESLAALSERTGDAGEESDLDSDGSTPSGNESDDEADSEDNDIDDTTEAEAQENVGVDKVRQDEVGHMSPLFVFLI